VSLVGLEKIVAGAIQAVLAAVVVFPIVYLVHADSEPPNVHVDNWPLFVTVIVFSAFLGSSLGLLIGTIIDPRVSQMLFAAIVLPITFLGCVYYSWATLEPIRWLQFLVLLNPLVYMSEALRATLTPEQPHMAIWAVLLVLVGGSIAVAALSLRTFTRRVVA
jgi:ABC-2 type transport system permease protein